MKAWMKAWMKESPNRPYTARQLAEYLEEQHIKVALNGNSNRRCVRLQPLVKAQADSLSFAVNDKQLDVLAKSQAGIVILPSNLESHCPITASSAQIWVEDVYLAYAFISKLFSTEPTFPTGCHPKAIVHPDAVISEGVSIGPFAVIEAGVIIGPNTLIGPHVYLGERVIVGSHCKIYPNVTLYHDVRIGNRVIIHSSAVIGSDGFGFAPSAEGWIKIHQIGGVVLGDDVEVGAGTTIDRGALEDTVIESGVKLDNQIQIAHNVRLGEKSALAACVGIAGSTKLGKGCTVGGGVGIGGHLDITDGVHFSGNTTVTRSVRASGSYSSGTVIEPSQQWRKNAARFRSLDDLFKRVRILEKKLP